MSQQSGSHSNSMERLTELMAPEDSSIEKEVVEHVFKLATELAREGREGRQVGTLFMIGDEDAVMQHSRPLILDPLLKHDAAVKHISDPDTQETVKELAQLDGGFIVSGDGVVHSAARYFSASSEGIDLPLGLGSRHMAAASITRVTRAVAIVVSESSVVRLFKNGEFLKEIIPELWMFRQEDRPSLEEKPPLGASPGRSQFP